MKQAACAMLMFLFFSAMVTYASGEIEKSACSELRMSILEARMSEGSQFVFLRVQFSIQAGALTINTYPNWQKYEVSINGEQFQSIGTGYYYRCRFSPEFIKQIEPSHPYVYDCPSFDRMGRPTSQIKSIQLRMTYPNEHANPDYLRELGFEDVWQGEVLSDVLEVRHQAPNSYKASSRQ